MARRKRSRRSRRLGSVITIRPLNGSERLNNPSSMLGSAGPVLLGGGAAILAAVGVRMWVTPTAENQALVNNADAVGAGVGALTGLILMNTTSKPAGVAAIAASVLLLAASRLPAMLDSAMPAAGTAGMGAIVAEQTMRGVRGRRMGAIVMSPVASRGYGQNAGGENIRLGRVHTAAFGTPSYQIGR